MAGAAMSQGRIAACLALDRESPIAPPCQQSLMPRRFLKGTCPVPCIRRWHGSSGDGSDESRERKDPWILHRREMGIHGEKGRQLGCSPGGRPRRQNIHRVFHHDRQLDCCLAVWLNLHVAELLNLHITGLLNGGRARYSCSTRILDYGV